MRSLFLVLKCLCRRTGFMFRNASGLFVNFINVALCIFEEVSLCLR